jgi:lipopolysaccharide transport system permease protein
MFAALRDGIADISRGLRLRHVWTALAQEDIEDQHRRTTLGPLWLLVNYLVYIGTFAVIFGEQTPIPNFVGYVATGMLVFLFLQEIMVQSITLFVREESFIAGTTLPLSVYVLRLGLQSIIRTGYAAVGCIGILLLIGTPVTPTWLWALLGLLVILLATPAVTVIFAMAGVFFPDLQFVVTNLIRVSMFFTPIFWVSAAGIRGRLYDLNPLTHFIEIVRMPIVEGELPIHSLEICVVFTAVCLLLAAYLLGRFRYQIVFLL